MLNVCASTVGSSFTFCNIFYSLCGNYTDRVHRPSFSLKADKSFYNSTFTQWVRHQHKKKEKWILSALTSTVNPCNASVTTPSSTHLTGIWILSAYLDYTTTLRQAIINRWQHNKVCCKDPILPSLKYYKNDSVQSTNTFVHKDEWAT